MSKYHMSAKGTLAPCKATKRCRLGGDTRHFSAELVKSVSEGTYTPASKLTAKDIADYQSQNPVASFKGMKPGTDITETFDYPRFEQESLLGYERAFETANQVIKTVVLDDDKAMIVSHHSYGKSVIGWLVQSHSDKMTPVGMVKLLYRPGTDYEYTITSMEVRPEYRGKGLSKDIATGITSGLGKPVYSSSSYTPEGLQRLSGLFPRKDKELGTSNMATKTSHESMNFVEDWDGFDMY